jgi:hypothetical protein
LIELQIRKDDPSIHRLVESANVDRDIDDGQIRVAVRQFGLSANNITYAVAGDRIGYWQFYPPIGEDPDGWGVMPVWGFAEVIESKSEEINVGERIFGFLPPATELTMTPHKVSKTRFVEGAVHRSQLPGAYNNYRRVNAEPGYDRATDIDRMLLTPLFATSFCLWDSLQDKDWYGAMQIVIGSASSKTGIGLSYALNDDPSSPSVTGLTSKRNLDFVIGLGTYDNVATYDSIATIDADQPTVIVDMSGNHQILGDLHDHLGDNMTKCVNVGITHWQNAGNNKRINSERSEFFFAPAHIQKRVSEWGPVGFEEKLSAFMSATAAKAREWMKIKKIDGLSGVSAIYGDVCEGRVPADQGVIVEL